MKTVHKNDKSKTKHRTLLKKKSYPHAKVNSESDSITKSKINDRFVFFTF